MIILKKHNIFFITLIFIFLLLTVSAYSGCRQYDGKLDISYFFKTEPEKSVIDFIFALNSKDAEYIYANYLTDSDRRNISREKFLREMADILSYVDNIEIQRVLYLGYENNMSKVVIEFKVYYKNGQESDYKKYIYLVEENGKWKIIFDKTFI